MFSSKTNATANDCMNHISLVIPPMIKSDNFIGGMND